MSCRLCASSSVVPVIDLGLQRITSRFPAYGDWSTPETPICLVQCSDCGLVQLRDLVPAEEMYEHLYGYRSGLNGMMRAHLASYSAELQEMVSLSPGDAVLDIGSNDATLLKTYPTSVRRVGCDPTGRQFAEFYTDGLELVPTYFTADAVTGPFRAVSSISMLYDLPDPVQFARDVESVLADDGIWTFEQSYILRMLEQNSFDTICHEHIEYYAVKQLKRIVETAGMKVIRISFNDCNGGSVRMYAAKQSSAYPEADLTAILQAELDAKLDDPDTYRAFMSRCDAELAKLKTFLRENPNTYLYGASTKGNCLLQYAGITLPLAIERNLEKIGKMTATGTLIVGEDVLRLTPPKNLLVLPWHFRSDFVAREREFLQSGGRLVFPLPTFSVVELKMTTESQASQDAFPRFILSKTPTAPKTFLDIGCYVPRDCNNTYLLEKAGWSGVAMDIRDLGHLWAAERTTPFLKADATTVDWVPLLRRTFGATRVIDYLSFDVDDATLPTFSRFPFDRYTFRTITIEHDAYRVGTALRDTLRQNLTALGYVLLCANVVYENHGPFEDWWVHPDHVDMAWAERIRSSDTHHRVLFNSMDYLLTTSA